MQLSEASLFMTFQNTAAIVLRDKGIVWVIHLLVGEPIKQLVIEAAWRPNKEGGGDGGCAGVTNTRNVCLEEAVLVQLPLTECLRTISQSFYPFIHSQRSVYTLGPNVLFLPKSPCTLTFLAHNTIE